MLVYPTMKMLSRDDRSTSRLPSDPLGNNYRPRLLRRFHLSTYIYIQDILSNSQNSDNISKDNADKKQIKWQKTEYFIQNSSTLVYILVTRLAFLET